MNTKIFLFLVVSLLVLPIVSSAPPTTIVSTVETGFQVDVTTVSHVQRDSTHHINVHVFNSTNGVPVGAKEGVSCYGDLYNKSGDHLIEVFELTRDGVEYEWDIGGTNFTNDGIYPYVIYCNTSVQGGFFSTAFDVTVSGEDEVIDNLPISITVAIMVIIVLYFIVLIRLFAERQFSEHGFIKMLFYLTAFWVILIPINILVIFADHYAAPEVVIEQVELLFQLMVYLNYFITIYFILWFVIQLLKKVGNTSNKLRFENG